jgi:hypothetical protein
MRGATGCAWPDSQPRLNHVARPGRQGPGLDIDATGRKIIPARGVNGLGFERAKSDVNLWMGFEACELILGLPNEAVADTAVTLDVFASDLDEPVIVGLLERLGGRLRPVIDDSTVLVTDFNLPTPKVFTGSAKLAPSG